jgi:hypothetical protein
MAEAPAASKCINAWEKERVLDSSRDLYYKPFTLVNKVLAY